jgi:hypothetical protein
MPLLLGIYSKRGRIRPGDYESLLEDFAQDGSRELVVEIDQRIVLAAVKQGGEPEYERIVENEDGSRVALFGGDLYEYAGSVRRLMELGHRFRDRESPAECLLHGFEEHGDAFFEQHDGTYAFAHYDRARDELTLANDSFGIHPLFIHDTDELCVFASEYEPLTRSASFDPGLDEDAIAQYFALRAPLGDRTFFRCIRNLRPGCVLTTGPGGTRLRQYDDLNVPIDHGRDIDACAAEMVALLRTVLARRFQGQDRVRCALTGGLDSRLTLGVMTEAQRSIAEFHTNQNRSPDPELDSEVVIARRIAEQYGLRHIVRVPQDLTQVRSVDDSFIERSRKLSGSYLRLESLYGGEFFGGDIFKVHGYLLDGLDPQWVESRLHEVFSPSVLERISDVRACPEAERSQLRAESRDLLFLIHFLTRGFFTTFGKGSPGGWVNPYRQMTYDLHSIYRDPSLLRFLLTVPPEYLLGHRLLDRVYVNHFPELCEIPTNRKGDVVPWFGAPPGPPPSKPSYTRILAEYVDSALTWNKGLYNEDSVRRAVRDESHWMVPAFADFESWYRARAVQR